MSGDDKNHAQRIREAVEDERKRLAQMLHDSVSQTLSALVLQARVAERRVSRISPEGAGDWQELGKSLQHAVEEVREVMRSLRTDYEDGEAPGG